MSHLTFDKAILLLSNLNFPNDLSLDGIRDGEILYIHDYLHEQPSPLTCNHLTLF